MSSYVGRFFDKGYALRRSTILSAQIQFYEARSQRIEVHRRHRGMPRNTPSGMTEAEFHGESKLLAT